MAGKLSFEGLEEGVERVAKKHKTTGPKAIKAIDAMISELIKCKQKLLDSGMHFKKLLMQAKIKEITRK